MRPGSDPGPFSVIRASRRFRGRHRAAAAHDRHHDALDGADSNVVTKLAFVRKFASSIGSTLDVLSWHTYDFETRDIGMTDHTTLSLHPETARLWSTKYLDFALRLSGNMTAIRTRAAPQADVWLTESDSICHQGIMGATNAYINSVWLVNRLGIMANASQSSLCLFGSSVLPLLGHTHRLQAVLGVPHHRHLAWLVVHHANCANLQENCWTRRHNTRH
mgnify:CR=1 FL=1